MGSSPSRRRGSTRSGEQPELTPSQTPLSTDDLVETLRRIQWFRQLPTAQLRTLCDRGRLECCSRYRTIIREGNRGDYFYVLLQGQVHCTSQTKKGLSVRLGPGSSFGEGALVTTVQREASVVALEPCQLMLLSSENMEGLDVELGSIRCHVVSLILETLPFFSDLTSKQHTDLASIMEMKLFDRDAVVFEEEAFGDAMYVLLSGVVEMRKRSESNQVIAEFRPMTERPWFGELALLGGGKQRRTCAAVCAEPCKVLVIRHGDFSTFLEVAPAFHSMFMSSATGYAALDAMRRKREDGDDVLKLLRGSMGSFVSGFSGAFGGGDDDADTDNVVAYKPAVLARWEKLAEPLIERVREERALAAERDAERLAAERASRSQRASAEARSLRASKEAHKEEEAAGLYELRLAEHEAQVTGHAVHADAAT